MSPSLEQRENRPLATELKFVVSPTVAEQIQNWAASRLTPDPNGEVPGEGSYVITSLYFDTANFDVFHRNGSFGRSKYRVRRYGTSDSVFGTQVEDTRVALKATLRSAAWRIEKLDNSTPETDWAGYWFHQRLLVRRLRPVCQIQYERAASVLMTSNGPVRLTMDRNIRALSLTQLGFDNVSSTLHLAPQDVILELKFRSELPVIFKLLVEEFALNPTPFSKYRRAATGLGIVSEKGLSAAESAGKVYA